jgi:hypothetical protein
MTDVELRVEVDRLVIRWQFAQIVADFDDIEEPT